MGALLSLLSLLNKLRPYFPTIEAGIVFIVDLFNKKPTTPVQGDIPIRSSHTPLPSSGIPIVTKQPSEIADEVSKTLQEFIKTGDSKYTPPKGKEPGQKHVSEIDGQVTTD